MPSVPFDLPTRLDALRRRDAAVAVIGLGYVGLPLARSAAEAGFRVVGIDIDPTKIQAFAEGRSYIRQHPYEGFAPLIAADRFRATLDMAAVADCAAVLICVPTPLTRQREPDLRFVAQTATAMAPHLRSGHLVVLESTTYPGTTREVLAPILEAGGLKSGRDLFLAYSPEREDPGNVAFDTGSIPKVVGADGDDALALALALYDQFVARTVPVSGLDTAEAVKITENIFRAVNIALVNELKVVKAALEATAKAVVEEQGVEIPYSFGTMIEVPRGALTADEIAVEAEFFSFGTNDLTQMTFGFSRDDSDKFLKPYVEQKILPGDPFESIDQTGVGLLMEMAIDKAKKVRPNIKLGICGEHGGEPESVKYCHKIGLNYVSCSPFRVPIARLAAAQAAIGKGAADK